MDWSLCLMELRRGNMLATAAPSSSATEGAPLLEVRSRSPQSAPRSVPTDRPPIRLIFSTVWKCVRAVPARTGT